MASARKERQEGSTWTLAEQLADGHALVRYGGVVTVAVPYERGPVGLREAVGRAQDRAHDAGVRLRPVWGDQAAAATLSLPLCRGWK
jgi:hypothetical protein